MRFGIAGLRRLFARKAAIKSCVRQNKPKARSLFLEPLESRRLLTTNYKLQVSPTSFNEDDSGTFYLVFDRFNDANVWTNSNLNFDYTIGGSASSGTDHSLTGGSVSMLGNNNDYQIQKSYQGVSDTYCEGLESIIVSIPTPLTDFLGNVYQIVDSSGAVHDDVPPAVEGWTAASL